MAEKRAIGRPPKYTSAEDMQRLIDLYYLACRSHQADDATMLEGLPVEDLLVIKDIVDVVPTISGLAYTLGMSTECFRTYTDKDEFSATVKTAKQRVEMSLEQRLAGNAVTGSIFSLKNNFGWKDKTESDVNLIGIDLSDRSTEDLMYYREHGKFPTAS